MLAGSLISGSFVAFWLFSVWRIIALAGLLAMPASGAGSTASAFSGPLLSRSLSLADDGRRRQASDEPLSSAAFAVEIARKSGVFWVLAMVAGSLFSGSFVVSWLFSLCRIVALAGLLGMPASGA